MKVDPTQGIPTVTSSPEVWIEWFKQLVSSYGPKEARALFIKAWSIRGNEKANTLALRDYLKTQGITISGNAWDSIVDAGGGAIDAFGNVLKVGKIAGLAIGGIIIIGFAMVVFNLARNPAKNIGIAAKAAM